jgi:hypothetical protein
MRHSDIVPSSWKQRKGGPLVRHDLFVVGCEGSTAWVGLACDRGVLPDALVLGNPVFQSISTPILSFLGLSRDERQG